MALWPGNRSGKGPRQEEVYDLLKLYGPMSETETAEKLHEQRDKPAGIPFEGKAKHNVVAQTGKILRRLAGLEKVHDINRGAEGTRPQWAVKLPEPKKHEPKVVTREGKEKQARQSRRGSVGLTSAAESPDQPSGKGERKSAEQKKADEKRRRDEYYEKLGGGKSKPANKPDSGGLGVVSPPSEPSGGDTSGGSIGIMGSPSRPSDSGKGDSGPRDGKIF